MTVSEQLPEYKCPPVVEVVCGIQFEPLPGLLVPHFGLLWEQYRKDYPSSREVPPLAAVTEQFETIDFSEQLQFPEFPLLPRVWFLTNPENGIIQLQRDRFLHNWKKIAETDQYPRYTTVIGRFRQHLETFDAFLAAQDIGIVRPRQYELTYVNHIPADKDFAAIFPDYAWRMNETRFLPRSEIINYRSSFRLPEQLGRLHVGIRSALNPADKLPMFYMDLTARGMAKTHSREDMWKWFDLAHEWIVNGFTDLTSESMHKTAWERTR